MSYLRCLCLFTCSGVQHILYCVFVLFFFVLCTLCCQFLCIVHFWFPLQYSPTFIYWKYSNQKLSNKSNYRPDHVLCVCKKSIQNQQIIFYLNDLNFFVKCINILEKWCSPVNTLHMKFKIFFKSALSNYTRLQKSSDQNVASALTGKLKNGESMFEY